MLAQLERPRVVTDPAMLQGVLAWNALNNRIEELRLVMGISPPSSNAGASARDRITDIRVAS